MGKAAKLLNVSLLQCLLLLSDRNEVHEVTRQKENGFLFVSAFELLLKLIENLTEVNTSFTCKLHVLKKRGSKCHEVLKLAL